MVSAGESVEVTLPRNEVELNAFVIPTPPEGEKTTRTGRTGRSYPAPTAASLVTVAASPQGAATPTTGA